MRLPLLPAIFFVLLAFPLQAWAGLHLGMKMACRRYGEAWDRRDRHALVAATGEDFRKLWARLPDEIVQKLPPSPSDVSIVGSRREGTRAAVSLSRAGRPVTILLANSGSGWKVVDIRLRERGRVVSVKDQLETAALVREFAALCSAPGCERFYQRLTPAFRRAFRRLPPPDSRRIRKFFAGKPGKVQTQFLPDGPNRASVVIDKTCDGARSRVTFSLCRQNRWLIDDLSIDGDRLVVRSLRDALPVLASVAALAGFMENPRAGDPQQFAEAGRLRDELFFVQRRGWAPAAMAAKPRRLVISPDLSSVMLDGAGRRVRLTMSRPRGKIVAMTVLRQDGAADVAHLLSVARHIETVAIMPTIRQLIGQVAKSAIIVQVKSASGF